MHTIMATLNTEIRKLQPKELDDLGQILDTADAWKKLMSLIPAENNPNKREFNNEHLLMIEEAIKQQKRRAADIFLSEWSTWGKKRPTCRVMLDLLVKAELFRAADYLAVNVLRGAPPQRPRSGPAAAVDITDEMLVHLLKQQAMLAEIESVQEEPYCLQEVQSDIIPACIDEYSVSLTASDKPIDSSTQDFDFPTSTSEYSVVSQSTTANEPSGLSKSGKTTSEFSGFPQPVPIYEHTELVGVPDAELPEMVLELNQRNNSSSVTS